MQLSNTFPKNTRLEGGASLGGFFIKDRIWFFGAYNKTNARPYDACADRGRRRGGRSSRQEYDGDIYSGKLTFRLGPSTDVQATVFADPQIEHGVADGHPDKLGPELVQRNP